MSVMSRIFGGSPNPAPAPVQQPAQPVQQPNNPAVAGNGNSSNVPVVPGVDPNITTPNQPASPLDGFKELWNTSPEVQKKLQEQNRVPLSDINPQQIIDSAKKIDFSKMISGDQLQAISKGGDEAVKAFAAAMNNVAQGVFAQSAATSQKFVMDALQQQQQQFNSRLPELIKQYQVSENLRGENPIFSNPAVQPIIKALEFQLTQQYPNSTAADITAKAKEYVKGLGSAFADKPAQTPQEKQAAQDTDWSSFLQM